MNSKQCVCTRACLYEVCSWLTRPHTALDKIYIRILLILKNQILMHLSMNIKKTFSEHLFCLEANSGTLAEMSWFVLFSDLLINISTFDLRHHSHKKRHIHLPKAHRILVLFWVWYVRNLFEQTLHLPQNIYKNLFNFITWY